MGCANGRHFSLLQNDRNRVIGMDNSLEFLRIARERIEKPQKYDLKDGRRLDLLLADIKKPPFRTHGIDHVISVASLHHVKGKENRKKSIQQIHRILKPRGNFVLTVWRKWQEKYKDHFLRDLRKRKFEEGYQKKQEEKGLHESGDKFVPWTLSSEGNTYQRFYHFFSAQEIKSLLKPFDLREFKVLGGPTKNDNFFIVVKKL